MENGMRATFCIEWPQFTEVIDGGRYVDGGHHEGGGHYAVAWGLIWLRFLCITKLQQKMGWEQLFPKCSHHLDHPNRWLPIACVCYASQAKRYVFLWFVVSAKLKNSILKNSKLILKSKFITQYFNQTHICIFNNHLPIQIHYHESFSLRSIIGLILNLTTTSSTFYNPLSDPTND